MIIMKKKTNSNNRFFSGLQLAKDMCSKGRSSHPTCPQTWVSEMPNQQLVHSEPGLEVWHSEHITAVTVLHHSALCFRKHAWDSHILESLTYPLDVLLLSWGAPHASASPIFGVSDSVINLYRWSFIGLTQWARLLRAPRQPSFSYHM